MDTANFTLTFRTYYIAYSVRCYVRTSLITSYLHSENLYVHVVWIVVVIKFGQSELENSRIKLFEMEHGKKGHHRTTE